MPKSDVGTNANNEIFFSEVTIPRSANKMLTLNPIANNAKRERAAQSAQRQQTHGESTSQLVIISSTLAVWLCVKVVLRGLRRAGRLGSAESGARVCRLFPIP